MNKKTACVILSIGERYRKLGKVAYNSFAKFNSQEVDIYHITEQNVGEYSCNSLIAKTSIGIFKYLLALEIMLTKKYKKMIILGSDTITCSRLDEFLDNDEDDILATLDYPYQFNARGVTSPDSETHLNADVVCFNNHSALEDVILCARSHDSYFEQGGLNEVVWSRKNYKTKLVEYPYKDSKVVYNVRSKGNIADTHGTKPWAEYVQKFYVKNDKLYSFDNKQIKVFHYCEGLGNLAINRFNEILNWWISFLFNKETKDFFKNKCDAGDFFEKKYEDT